MGFPAWAQQNWFELLQTAVIAANGYAWTYTIRKDRRDAYRENEERKNATLTNLAEQHSELWGRTAGNPELSRVLNTQVDLKVHPMTDDEFIFVRQVILHAQNVFSTAKLGLIAEIQGMRKDVAETLALPIAAAVWSRTREYMNEDFVEFVEGSSLPADKEPI